MTENLIVTRHAPLVEWLRQHGIEGRVIAQATPDDVRGKHVYGILPLWLAAEAETVTEVSMPGLPLEARSKVNGGDFTVEQMNEWGAEMRTFVVIGGDTADWLKRNGKDKIETGLHFL